MALQDEDVEVSNDLLCAGKSGISVLDIPSRKVSRLTFSSA